MLIGKSCSMGGERKIERERERERERNDRGVFDISFHSPQYIPGGPCLDVQSLGL